MLRKCEDKFAKFCTILFQFPKECTCLFYFSFTIKNESTTIFILIIIIFFFSQDISLNCSYVCD